MKKFKESGKSGHERKGFSRRDFVKISGITALGVSSFGFSDFANVKGVSIIVDPTDLIAGLPASQWAGKELQESLISREIKVFRCESLAQVKNGDLLIFVAGLNSTLAQKLIRTAGTNIPAVPEALGLLPVKFEGKQVLLACGNDERGLTYALLELADRVHNSQRPVESIDIQKPIIEQPANVVRSLLRTFASEVEDKPWYNDKEMWPAYLTMLATQRFNRFNLSMGMGVSNLHNIVDAYFLFAYPFFLSVPGYNVRVPQLPDAERDENLEMLKFISEQTVARGIQFQLGIWVSGYEWINSPNPNYTIEGLTPETHGPYCRDAVRALLKACPAIGGITFRVHGESGVKEGSYNFWKGIFDGVATCGRRVTIDIHAKGTDQALMDSAIATGMPISMSTKYWAEHMGMPYHQADIRALEIPRQRKTTSGMFSISSGSRSFLRYGYGDLLKKDRGYDVLTRIWPGTHKLLLWGDPAGAAANSGVFSFCGSIGAELMEPLSHKGSRGTGIAGGRCGYSDKSLEPRWDWEKFLYTLRVFGRLQYNPDTEPDVWRRYLLKQFGSGAKSVELALANATRILPIVTTVHSASAAFRSYWPEMYTNQSIPDPNKKSPYSDTPSPKVFGNVSPLDPQIFVGINEFARDLLKSEYSGKYTPVDAAQWIEDYAGFALDHLAQAEASAKNIKSPEFRRMAIDVSIISNVGRFFSAKFRSGVLYGIFEESGDRSALEQSLKYYQKARNFWAELAHLTKDIYKSNITFTGGNLSGHWLDRLPAIDEDIAFMANKLEHTQNNVGTQAENVRLAIQEATGRPKRPFADCHHVPAEQFQSKQSLDIELSFKKMPKWVRLYYRHVNQAERWESIEMSHIAGSRFRATIPSEYTNSPYALEYYFQFKEMPASAVLLYPGFNKDLTNQPYFLVRQV